MARKHLLEGLMNWTMREPWRDRFDAVLEDHVLPTCDETGLEADEIVSTLGEDLFMSTVWACAFEDLLTRIRSHRQGTTYYQPIEREETP